MKPLDENMLVANGTEADGVTDVALGHEIGHQANADDSPRRPRRTRQGLVRPNCAALIAIRRAHGLSQGQLARLSGVSQGHISDIESGDRIPRLGTLSLLATALLVPVPALLVTGEEIALSLDATCQMLSQAGAETWDDPEARRAGVQLRSLLLDVSALDDQQPAPPT